MRHSFGQRTAILAIVIVIPQASRSDQGNRRTTPRMVKHRGRNRHESFVYRAVIPRQMLRANGFDDCLGIGRRPRPPARGFFHALLLEDSSCCSFGGLCCCQPTYRRNHRQRTDKCSSAILSMRDRPFAAYEQASYFAADDVLQHHLVQRQISHELFQLAVLFLERPTVIN